MTKITTVAARSIRVGTVFADGATVMERHTAEGLLKFVCDDGREMTYRSSDRVKVTY